MAKIDIDQYRYKNIVIMPHYTLPSIYIALTGNVFIDFAYTQDYSRRMSQGQRCAYIKPRYTIKGPCIYGGDLWLHFGHFILESLCNAYFIKKLPNYYPLIFSSFQQSNLLNFQKEVLDILNIKNKILLINDVTLFNDIYVPPPGFSVKHVYKEQADCLGICENKIQPGKKIYLSRTQLRNQAILNENEIERMLRSRDWTIIYPEKLSVRQQLDELSSAEIVFGCCGSAFHSLIFLKNPQQRFIVLPRSHTARYNLIANLKSDNYYLLDINYKILNPDDAPDIKKYVFDLNQFKIIIEDSDDFLNIDKIDKTILRRPDKFDYDITAFPVNYSDKAKHIRPEYSLIYRVLRYIHLKKDKDIAIKCFRMLVKKNKIDNDMFQTCLNFMEAAQINLLDAMNAPDLDTAIARMSANVEKTPDLRWPKFALAALMQAKLKG